MPVPIVRPLFLASRLYRSLSRSYSSRVGARPLSFAVFVGIGVDLATVTFALWLTFAFAVVFEFSLWLQPARPSAMAEIAASAGNVSFILRPPVTDLRQVLK